MMSVIVENPGGEYEILTKGAPEAVFAKCSQFESEGIFPDGADPDGDLVQEYNDLSADGFRVLAVASKKVDKRAAYSKTDEADLVLKDTSPSSTRQGNRRKAIAALQQHGVVVKVLTGDNDWSHAKSARTWAWRRGRFSSQRVEHMTDEQLSKAVETTHVFARLSPNHKQRWSKPCAATACVGFMGDGINDAPPCARTWHFRGHGVDIARESPT